MVVVTIIAIFAALGMPSFSGLIDRYRLKGTADALHAEIQFARSEAIRRNQEVHLVFGTGSGSCYGIGTNADCGCDTCDIRTRATAAFASDFPGVRIDSVTAAGAAATGFGFTPRQGTTTANGAVRVTVGSVRSGLQLTVATGLLGIPRTCSPGAAVPGYPACE
ncbi:MAG: hypothetical protein RIS35_288 [Pseudomonadota bacterium]|jgi:type IV fimbrial biogenesis protein FimT